jgi:hypothetical protein
MVKKKKEKAIAPPPFEYTVVDRKRACKLSLQGCQMYYAKAHASTGITRDQYQAKGKFLEEFYHAFELKPKSISKAGKIQMERLVEFNRLNREQLYSEYLAKYPPVEPVAETPKPSRYYCKGSDPKRSDKRSRYFVSYRRERATLKALEEVEFNYSRADYRANRYVLKVLIPAWHRCLHKDKGRIDRLYNLISEHMEYHKFTRLLESKLSIEGNDSDIHLNFPIGQSA